MKYDKYAKQFLNNIKDCISEQTKDFVSIKSAKISRVNDNGTVNVEFPEDGGTWSNITNQSIYQDLKVGDEVKLIQQNGVLKNTWIIGAMQTSKKDNILQQVNKQMDEQKETATNEGIYVKTSEEVTSIDAKKGPSILPQYYPHKFCIHTVFVGSSEIYDYVYFSRRNGSEYIWEQVI